MRCDINAFPAPMGSDTLNRTEIKRETLPNFVENSPRSFERQADILEDGGRIIQENACTMPTWTKPTAHAQSKEVTPTTTVIFPS